MDKQNTLIITYEMVPFTTDWGGCQRVFYYSKFLSDNNHNIIVIASKNSNKVNYYGQTTSFRVIHLKNLGHSIGISGNYSAVSKTKRHLKNILKIIVRYFEKQAINNPSIGVGINSFLWVVMNNNRIIDIIKKNNVYNVIISAPPFGLFSLYLIRKLLKNIGGGVTIDYRDPWNCWWGDKSIAYYREKAICRLAKNIIVTNTNHKRKLMIDFGIPQKKISVVMNGYDVNTWSKVIERNIKRRNDKFIIRYIGNIDLRNQNKFRDKNGNEV